LGGEGEKWSLVTGNQRITNRKNESFIVIAAQMSTRNRAQVEKGGGVVGGENIPIPESFYGRLQMSSESMTTDRLLLFYSLQETPTAAGLKA
jgi:hypothetical protein